jgi:HK97 family phage prohead protease
MDITARADARTNIVRQFDFTECEFRDGDGDEMIFEGIASVVDTPYSVRDQWGEFDETIRAGAFTKTLKDSKADVALFVNHDYRALPLATRATGSLTLSADPHLEVRARLNPARPSVQEAYHAVRDGHARQMSIGFSVPQARDSWSDDMTKREISEVKLSETSIVWRGANPHTVGAVRTLDDLIAQFPAGADVDPDELRRAIAHLEGLLPVVDLDELRQDDTPNPERLAALLLSWDQYRNPAA